MGLRKCKDCDKEFSERAEKCPHCGALHADATGPIRWLAWLVVLLVSGAAIFAGLNTMYGSVVAAIAVAILVMIILVGAGAMLLINANGS